MMDYLLALLALPLLISLPLVPVGLLQGTVGRITLVALPIAALGLVTGSLSPAVIATWSADVSSRHLFVSINTGLILGALIPWPPGSWRGLAGGLPLAIGSQVVALSAFSIGPWLLGIVLGALPFALGDALPRRRAGTFQVGAASPLEVGAVLVALLSVVWGISLFLALATTILAVWLTATGNWPGRLRASAVSSLLISVGVLALTVGGLGAPLSELWALAPISPAAERQLSFQLTIAVLLMAAPWPLHGSVSGTVIAPVVLAWAFRLSHDLAPVSTPGWLALATMILVTGALITAWLGRWSPTLLAVALLGALRTEPLPLIGAALLLLAITVVQLGNWNRRSQDPVTLKGERWACWLVASGTACVIAGILADEVVMTCLLAAAMAAAFARRPVMTDGH